MPDLDLNQAVASDLTNAVKNFLVNSATTDAAGEDNETPWIDAYSGLNADVKLILEETVSNLAAIYCIQYDMSGYTSRGEAEDMISVLRDAAIRNLSLLKNKNKQDFINDA